MSASKRSIQLLGFTLPVLLLIVGIPGEGFAQSTWQKMKLNILQQACKGGDQNACQALAKLNQKLSQPAQGPPAQGPPTQEQPQPTQTQSQPQAQTQTQPQQSGPQSEGQPAADVLNGNHGANTSAATPAESAGEQATGSQDAWAPPTANATPSKPNAPLDPLKLPDIQGIHPGMTVEQATQVIAKLAPGTRIPWYNSPMLIPTSNIVVGHAANMVTVQYDYIDVGGGQKNYTHELNLDATRPPSQERIWHIGFKAQIQHINRAVLVAALRKKYGKELVATDAHEQPVNDDRLISNLWWAFDEQGHPMSPAPAFVNSTPNGCLGPGPGTNARPYGDDDTSARSSAKNPGCMWVGVHAQFPDAVAGEILNYYALSLWDAPLSVRDFKVTDAWLQVQLEKARQEALQRSKEAKPVM